MQDTTWRIGFVTAFPPGRNSLNEFGFHFVNHMASADGVDALVVLADDTDAGPPDVSEIRANNPNATVEAEAVWSFNDAANPLRILRAVRRHKLDAVIINLQFATFGDGKVPGALGLLTPAALRAAGVPTGLILHNLADNVDMQDAGFTDSAVMAAVMNKAGRVLTRALLLSDYVALTIPRYVEFVRDSYGAKNVLLVPHGSFEEMEEPTFGIPDGPKRKILAFGKWGTYKTVDVLVDAFRDLIGRGYEDLELVIAGTDSPNSPGYLDSIAAGCSDLDNVTFTGYVAEEDVAELFTSSAVTAFPYTSTTGSSGVLHQAGSYGRSAALPDIGDFTEVIEEEGFIGQYFTPGDASSLADSLAKLLDDEELNAEHGERNYLAASGIPMAEICDWHITHLNRVIEQK